MVKFAHFADCHLGSWRQEELQKLNFESFQKAISRCIDEEINFLLISGDLFDSAYPSIEILKKTFAEFKRLNDANIPAYIIAGSHDFSASGKTFLDVLEKTGFCKNIEKKEIQEDGTIKLFPHFYKDLAIFGYSGKKSGMEIEDIKKIRFDSVYPLSIFMLHTTIKDVVGTIPMDSISSDKLPLANYYALGHIHQRFKKEEANSVFVYPGPLFPNNFQELVDLKHGSFEIVNMENGRINTKNIEIPLKEVLLIELTISNGLIATEQIIEEINRLNLQDKIVLLKLKGILLEGKSGDIRFNEIEEFIKKKGAYSQLRNISSLKTSEADFEIKATDSEDIENIEKKILGEYTQKNPTNFDKFLPELMNIFSIERNEDEKTVLFEKRLMDELKNILELPKENDL